MKKRIVFFTVIFTLLAQIVFANPSINLDLEVDFLNAFRNSDLTRMERLLQENRNRMNLSALVSTIVEGLFFTNHQNIAPINTDRVFAVNTIKLLSRYGTNFTTAPDYFYAVDRHNGFIGTVNNAPRVIGAPYILQRAIMLGDINIIRALLEGGANMYRYNLNLAIDLFPMRDDDIAIARLLIENGYNVNRPYTGDGSIYLLYQAALQGQIGIVRLLVESGAMVNRANAGINQTAAQAAYERGHIDIYNYLRQNGATWTAPSQVASAPPPSTQQPRTTNNHSPPPPPSSSGSSSSSTPPRNTGRDVVDTINRAFEAPIQNGTYRLSGRTEQFSFAGIARSGNVTFRDAAGTSHRGTYSIDGTRLTINVMGRSFFYTITSSTSFSGHGEEWFRTGF